MPTENARSDADLYRLMTWLSPAYPVGAFSYSHGLEYIVETGLVTDKDTLVRWIEGVLRFGAAHTDAVLFSHAWHAVTDNDCAQFIDIATRASALRGTAELALETNGPGDAFASTLVRTTPPAGFAAWQKTLADAGVSMTYPIAVALATALAAIPQATALTAYLHAFVANLVSAGVRLVPLGQTDGQAAIAELASTVFETAGAASAIALNDMGSAAVMVDWASMQHETQYTRLFRS